MTPATDWVAGPQGYALDFDGTNDYIAISGDEDTFDVSAAGASIIVTHIDGGDENDVLWSKWYDGSARAYDFGIKSLSRLGSQYSTNGSDATTIYSDISAIPSGPYWAAVVFTASAATFYVNGRPVGSPSLSGAINNNAMSPVIGKSWNASAYFTGTLGAYLFYDRALSPQEIKTLYQDPWALFHITRFGYVRGVTLPTGDLTANDLTAGTPAIDSPTLGQTHALTANDLTSGTPAIDSPTLTETHALTANDLTAGTPTIDSPTLAEIHVLTASDVTAGTPTIDSPTIGQAHALTASDITAGTPTIDSPTLTEAADNLTIGDLTAGTPTIDSPAIGQVHALTANELSTTPTLDSPTLGQIHALTVGELTTGVPTIDSPTLAQANALTVGDLTAGTPSIDSPTLGQIHALTASDVSTTPTIESPVFSKIVDLTTSDITTGAPTIDSPTLSSGANLVALTIGDVTLGAPTIASPSINFTPFEVIGFSTPVTVLLELDTPLR
jgi:hypothetical protein